jgi:hypothetical protein
MNASFRRFIYSTVFGYELLTSYLLWRFGMGTASIVMMIAAFTTILAHPGYGEEEK